jgi:hypothetical protein
MFDEDELVEFFVGDGNLLEDGIAFVGRGYCVATESGRIVVYRLDLKDDIGVRSLHRNPQEFRILTVENVDEARRYYLGLRDSEEYPDDLRGLPHTIVETIRCLVLDQALVKERLQLIAARKFMTRFRVKSWIDTRMPRPHVWVPSWKPGVGSVWWAYVRELRGDENDDRVVEAALSLELGELLQASSATRQIGYKAGEWMSVETGLPDIGKGVLVMVKLNGGKGSVHLEPRYGYRYKSTEDNNQVTLWNVSGVSGDLVVMMWRTLPLPPYKLIKIACECEEGV